MFITKLATAGALWAAGAVAAQAVPVSIGGYWVETNQEVNSLSSFSGTFATQPHDYADIGALDNNWGGIFNNILGEDAFLSFTGADPGSGNPPNTFLLATFESAISNLAGYDVYVFESGDSPANAAGQPTSPSDPTNAEVELVSVRKTDGSGNGLGSWMDLAVLGFIPANQVGGTGTSTGVYVYGLDIADLGISTLSELFVGNTASFLDHDPDVIYAAGVAAVPLPAALPLLASGLGALGIVGWRRRRVGAAS